MVSLLKEVGFNNGVPIKHNVIVFIPGFNSCLTSALEVYGQFITLGGYPEDIYDHFVFQWPAGTIASFYQAKDSAQSDMFMTHFRTFLQRLYALGMRRVTIMAHSMAARAVVRPELYEEDLEGIEIENLILISPEVDLQTFQREGPALVALVTNAITIYADAHDQALFWAELFNRRSLFWGSSLRSLGKAVTERMKDDQGRVMDVDVINTSDCSSNVQELRHCYFSISREVIEDMHQLIVGHTRAAQRPARLIRQYDIQQDKSHIPATHRRHHYQQSFAFQGDIENTRSSESAEEKVFTERRPSTISITEGHFDGPDSSDDTMTNIYCFLVAPSFITK
jgi:esterase/lipase superfamily enzyme